MRCLSVPRELDTIRDSGLGMGTREQLAERRDLYSLVWPTAATGLPHHLLCIGHRFKICRSGQ